MAASPASTGLEPSVAERVSGEVLDSAVHAAWTRAGMTTAEASTLTTHRRLLERAVRVEYHAFPQDGTYVSHCELRTDDDVCQIDAVLTDPRYQQRGYARATISAALHRAAEIGCRLVFLQTDAGDWPHRFYERLGFRTIGDVAAFTT